MPAARASTEEEAANLALSHLREPGIALMSEETVAARAVRKWFGTVRHKLLAATDWNFATAYVTPAADAVESAGSLSIRYPLPGDAVRVRSVADHGVDEWALESAVVTIAGAEVEAKFLVSNETAPVICYTRDVTNVRLWDPEFLTAFAYELAKAMAGEFGKSAADIEGYDAYADEDLSSAKRRDARERAPARINTDTSWLRARAGWRYR